MDVADNMVDEMSEPREDLPFVSAGTAEQVTTEAKTTNLTDRKGRSFDPELHCHENGIPLLTKKGKLRVNQQSEKYRESMKGRVGRPKNTASGGPTRGVHRSSIGGLDGPSTGPDMTQSFRACGVTAAQGVFTVGRAIGGDEWTPSSSETAYMQDAWTGYFEAKQISDIPPGVVLITALVSYAAPRFGKPVTKKRMSRFFDYLKRMGRNIRAKFDRNYALNLGEYSEPEGTGIAQMGPA